MKNFTIAFAALATITLASSTTFAATPFCGTSQYNTRYNDSTSHRNWNDKYSQYNSRDYSNSRRVSNQYDYLPTRYNGSYNTNRCATSPLTTNYTYRPRTSYNSYPSSNNRYDYNHNRSNNYQSSYHHNNWRVGR